MEEIALRHLRQIAIVVLAALGVALVGYHLWVHDRTSGEYAALGDSFASGAGAGSYLEGQPGVPESCFSSRNAYPQVIANHLQLDGALHNYGCAGEQAWDVLNDRATTPGEAPQLLRVSSQTQLVTVSIAGNDLGFRQIVQACEFPHSDQTCLAQRDTLRQRVELIQGTLHRLYQLLHVRALGAHIWVVGYPNFIPDDANVTALCPELGFSIAKLHFLREVAGWLNQAIKNATDGVANVEFVDTQGVLERPAQIEDHKLCSEHPWVHELALPIGQSFHPNEDGQRAIGEEMLKHMVPFGVMV